MRVVPGLLALVLASVAASGCSSESSAFDPFPIPVDDSDGPVLVDLHVGAERMTAVIDTLTPITIVDSAAASGVIDPPRRRSLTLTLFAPDPDGDAGAVPRARFADVEALDLHPCRAEDPAAVSPCQVGTGDAPRPIGAIIGADVLARGAVRFELGAGSVRLFPDIAGTDEARGQACDAVFDAPFFGGGTLRIAGAELPYTGRRIAMGACLAFDPVPTNPVVRGVDAMLLVSTGIGPTVLSESAYARYARADDTVAPVDTLPTTTLHVPGGSFSVRAGSMRRVALVGEASDERGPCAEVYAHRAVAADACTDGDTGFSCPCESDFCRTAAVVELAGEEGASIDIVVLPDSSPLLTGLRDELRPQLPEIDGILGAQALHALRLDVDYPHDRLVARCAEGADCVARPQLRTRTSIPDVNGCVTDAQPPL